MPIISESRGYLFVLSPRTGSSAIANGVLIPYLDGRWFPENEITHGGRVLVARKHSPLRPLLQHGLLDRRKARDLLKFSTVRNPFDSMTSLYIKQRETYQPMLEDPTSWVHRRPDYIQAMAVAENESFGEWLRFVLGPRTRKQRLYALARGTFYPRHLYGGHIAGMDMVLRQESLQEDFDLVLERLGVRERLVIPTLNVTEEKTDDFRSFYDRETRVFAERVFAPDIRRFGYSFERR